MNDEHGPLDGGMQLRLAAEGVAAKRQRLDGAGVNDIAMLVLYYLSLLHRTDRRRVLYRALQILDRP